MNKRVDVEFKKRWIQWVLDFIQMDLNSLSKINRRKLASEIVYFCGDDFFKFDWDDWEYNVSLSAEERGDLMNKYLNEMEEDPSKIQEGLKSSINIIVKMSSLPDEEPYIWELPDTYSFLYIGWIFKEPNFFERGIFNMVSRPKEDSLINWAIINLTKLLEQLEVHSIKKCKGCGRYFLNLTLKKKIFCNSVCASRFIAHQRYEELRKDPKKYEAHLKHYRKLSEKRYERMRKEQYGPNVKIQKRRNKRKEG